MEWRPVFRNAALIGAVLAAAACTPQPQQPNLQQIYTRMASAGAAELHHPLITVPGMMGSRLADRDSGVVVWGGGGHGISADPDSPEGARLIALPIVGPETPISEIRDNVVAAGVLDTAQATVLGIPVRIDIYGGIERMLAAGGFRTAPEEHPFPGRRGGPGPASDRDEAAALPSDPPGARGPTLADYRRIIEDDSNQFRFDYDWRRDIPALARELHAFVLKRRRRVAALRSLGGENIRPEDVRFDLLAHSMGGLVARYYLMHGPADLPADGSLPPITWEGARYFNRVIFVAPPNAGTISALDNLVNGKEIGPFQPVYPAALPGTHPSVYQLMPRFRHGRLRVRGPDSELVADPYDPALWERFGWGLADPAAAGYLAWLMPEIADPDERRSRALAHLRRLLARAEQFHRAMDRWTPPPGHLELYLVVGGGLRTPASALVDGETGRFEITDTEEGDGVVLRASALLDERQGGGTAASLRTPLRFKTVLLLPDAHIALTRNPVFGDNLLFWLLEQPRDSGRPARPEAPAVLAALLADGGENPVRPRGAPDR